MKPAVALLALLLLAGCASPQAPAEDVPERVSEPASAEGPQYRTVHLLDEEFGSEGLGASGEWTVQVPANVTNVGVTFVYASRFFHMGLHMELAGCGARDYSGPGGALHIDTPGTWYYPVCATATPGEHKFTITVDPGSLSDAVLKLHGDQLVGNGTAA